MQTITIEELSSLKHFIQNNYPVSNDEILRSISNEHIKYGKEIYQHFVNNGRSIYESIGYTGAGHTKYTMYHSQFENKIYCIRNRLTENGYIYVCYTIIESASVFDNYMF